MAEWTLATRYPGDPTIQDPASARSFELTRDGWAAVDADGSRKTVSAAHVVQATGNSMAEHVRLATLRLVLDLTEELKRHLIDGFQGDAVAARFKATLAVLDARRADLAGLEPPASSRSGQ